MTDVPHLHPDELLVHLDKPGLLAVLYTGEGPIQDRARTAMNIVSRRWELRGVRCVSVRANILPTRRDNRLVAVRVPQLRVFRNGRLIHSYVGLSDVEERLALDSPED